MPNSIITKWTKQLESSDIQSVIQSIKKYQLNKKSYSQRIVSDFLIYLINNDKHETYLKFLEAGINDFTLQENSIKYSILEGKVGIINGVIARKQFQFNENFLILAFQENQFNIVEAIAKAIEITPELEKKLLSLAIHDLSMQKMIFIFNKNIPVDYEYFYLMIKNIATKVHQKHKSHDLFDDEYKEHVIAIKNIVSIVILKSNNIPKDTLLKLAIFLIKSISIQNIENFSTKEIHSTLKDEATICLFKHFIPKLFDKDSEKILMYPKMKFSIQEKLKTTLNLSVSDEQNVLYRRYILNLLNNFPVSLRDTEIEYRKLLKPIKNQSKSV